MRKLHVSFLYGIKRERRVPFDVFPFHNILYQLDIMKSIYTTLKYGI